MSASVLWEPLGLYKRYEGFVTGADLLSLAHSIHTDPRFDRSRYSIEDYSGVTSFEIDAITLEALAAHVIGAGLSRQSGCFAFVTTDPKARAAIARFVELTGSTHPSAVFDDLPSARRWVEQQLQPAVSR